MTPVLVGLNAKASTRLGGPSRTLLSARRLAPMASGPLQIERQLAAPRPVERARQIGLQASSDSITRCMTHVNARVVVEVVSDDEDPSLKSGAAEGGVAGFLVQVVGSEDERLVGGEALCLVVMA